MTATTAPPAAAPPLTRWAALASVGVASVLIGLKLWAWLASGSAGLLASLGDSSLDLAASLFTLWAVSYAATPADAEHRHGHGKAEGFAALTQALLIGVAVTVIGFESVQALLNPRAVAAEALAVAVMLVSIVLTAGLVTFQGWVVARTASVATAGDRLHYLTDLASNLAVLVGLGLSVGLGWLWADGVVGLVVAGWLAWGAFSVARAGVDELMDRELPEAERAEITRLALDGPGIRAVHQLRTRRAGPHVHVTFHADMDASLTLAAAHRLMVAAEDRIRAAFPGADVLIHPDPEGEAEAHGLPHLAVREP
jgi:cation diffusion facilitator family transporter